MLYLTVVPKHMREGVSSVCRFPLAFLHAIGYPFEDCVGVRRAEADGVGFTQ